VALWIAATVIFAAIVNRRHPPIGSFTQVDGVRFHYLGRGNSEGLELVLLHGNGMMVQDFLISGVLEQASPHYRVLCFDRPGFGHSEQPRGRIQADLIAAALRQLGVRPSRSRTAT
jgi:pimeloyl-ACP methyl ester carboxylesterase